MNDEISIFAGVKPEPVGITDWMSVLTNIRSEKYRDAIERCRQIKDVAAYRKEKTRLPSVTFCARFNKTRNSKSVVSATGFIIPDLDHIEDVESVFSSLIQDDNVWFAFRSPSGQGIKCGIRADGIQYDDDIKKMFNAVSRYFKDTYGILIDPACKDISRLTFVSCDPNLFINESPCLFDVQKWTKEPEQRFYLPPEQRNGWKANYGRKVLESCCKDIVESVKGQQHNTRIRKATLIGGFIASGFIDEQTALSELEQAIITSGAVRVGDAMKTVQDGIKYGKSKPLHPVEKQVDPDGPDYWDYSIPDDDHVSTCNSMKADVSTCKPCKHDVSAMSAGCKLYVSEDAFHVSNVSSELVDPYATGVIRSPNSLMGRIGNWITNSDGCFSVEQLDRELCLKTRAEKNNRARVLHYYTSNSSNILIKKDKQKKGIYHTVNKTVEWLDLSNVQETNFPILLPLNLHEHITIPNRAIIIVTGTTNAGKTAYMLNLIRMNLSQEYQKAYLMSEMVGTEYVSRIRAFGDTVEDWKSVRVACKSYDFSSVIAHHNTEGLTCIDFLEEIDGEYFKIASAIRDIYDSLTTGVAVIGIQKKTATDYARGGQATAEKARLYLSIDALYNSSDFTICALKVVKAKYYTDKNLNNHEIHFKLIRGTKIEPITGWMPCHNLNRDFFINKYSQPSFFEKNDQDESEHEKAVDTKGSTAIYFNTVEGQEVRVIDKDLSAWQERFQKINVRASLLEISKNSKKKAFLKKDNYFYLLSNLLDKENKRKMNF